MKKVQNSAFKDSAYDELCERYENRARTYSKSPESAELKSREILTRSVAPSSYKVSRRTVDERNRYKNGVEGNERFMTESDFASYYRANRDYTPTSNIEDDSTASLQAIENTRYRRNAPAPKTAEKGVKNKLLREAAIINPKPAPKRAKQAEKKTSEKKAPEKKIPEKKTPERKINAKSEGTANKKQPVAQKNEKPIKRDAPKRKEEEQSKIPLGAMIAIGVVGFSLVLIAVSAIILALA